MRRGSAAALLIGGCASSTPTPPPPQPFVNRRGEITNRRLATAADGCAQGRHEPLRRG
jgi:hypothetical protein